MNIARSRRWGIGALAALLAVSTTAWGEALASAPPSGSELRLWGWASSEAEDETLNSLLDEYAALSGTTVTFEPQADPDTALQTSLASGEAPDLFYIDSADLPDLADAGVLEPVPAGALTEPDDIYPSLRDVFTYDGTYYCPPKDFSTLALVYDADALSEAGIDPPTTLDELATAAEALTTPDRAGLSLHPGLVRVGPFLLANGGYIVNDDVTEMTLDTDANAATLQYLADLFQSGAARTPADLEAESAQQALGQGNAAMIVEGNWVIPYLEDSFPDRNWAVAEFPAGTAGRATYAFTVCYGVSTLSPNPDASWAAIDFLAGPVGAAEWTSGIAAMPARASLRDGWLETHPGLEAFVDGAEYASRYQFVPGFADVVNEFDSQFEQLVGGDTDVEGFIEAVTDAGESVL